MTGSLDINLEVLSSGYDRQSCWVHPRPAFMPGQPARAIVTMQKLRLTGDDVFQGTYDLYSEDGGGHWTAARLQSGLGRHRVSDDLEEGPSDLTPGWHVASGTLLVIGHTVWYRNDTLLPVPRPRNTAYSVWEPKSGSWKTWKKLEFPKGERFSMEGAGSTQRWDLPNGDILLPTYFALKGTENGTHYMEHASTVLRCSFDGETLRYLDHGSELTVPTGRGFVEPSITRVAGRYFLTLRNDLAGYVTVSADGLHYDPPTPWRFDDGSELGNYNTQQHWVTHHDDLYLVYTRRGANNDHIMRHRAPLFIARVDTQRLCVIRATERILVPERGARLCNFGVTKVSDDETWITVAEWMQTTLPNPFDSTVCEKYGSDNSVFLVRLRFQNGE